jgi:nitroimidazol reductase NimA-like FMN-containing flavoprotein (pyridoxamine 5'-phosphate oxidase superfamily)
MIVDDGLELLTEDQARSLLARGEVGRVGITLGAMPAIFPVNYRLIDGSIVFRTAPGSKMSAAAEGAVVAFEVDDYQLADRSGWSVLAVGRAEVVHDLATSFEVLESRLEPFGRWEPDDDRADRADVHLWSTHHPRPARRLTLTPTEDRLSAAA